jgi:hypothetical protein
MAAALEDCRNWKNIKDALCKIERLISYYEMKEATTIFELVLWKKQSLFRQRAAYQIATISYRSTRSSEIFWNTPLFDRKLSIDNFNFINTVEEFADL